jgi:hypothetical protein
MAGRHRDPLRPITGMIIIGCIVLTVVVIVCYRTGFPSIEFWERS